MGSRPAGAPLPPRGSPVKGARDPRVPAAGLAPGFEACRYGEVEGVAVVLLDAPSRPDGIELALRAYGPPVQTVAFPVNAAGALIRTLLIALDDLGEVDRLIREEMEHRALVSGARPVN